MKVLQICHKPPLPAIDGGCLAMNDISNGLIKKGCDLKILTLSTTKHPFRKDKLSDNYLRTTKIEHVQIDTDLKPSAAFMNLFSSESYNINRFYSKEFEEKIVSQLKSNRFDVIHLESLFVVPYLSVIRKNSTAKVVYRAHNIEQQIWWEKYSQCNNPLKKSYLKILHQRLKRFEDQHLNSFDGIASISKMDIQKLKELGCTIPCVEIPFSINPTIYYPTSTNASNDLFYLGSLDWMPNIEGLNWFIKNCWEKLVSKHPNLKLHIAGKSMPESIAKIKTKGIVIHGEVPDAMDFIRAQGIMIVPLFSGSGIRIKILEGMALEKAIVGTSKAMEGIHLTEKEGCIADTSEEFCAAIEKLHLNSELQQEMGKNARNFVKKHFNNDEIINQLMEFYSAI